MEYILDAWLERPLPLVRIWERGSGRLLLRLDHQRLRCLSEAGEVDLSELARADRREAARLAERMVEVAKAAG